ncbi:MAG: DUF748 domain-containing protein [Defluviicoccus sp.]|nr:DUF748 domain-containing protein [Defluviicoccus sp.]MDG4593364.1 DUF748 domain-containing protein [Defluviicoccus sp.]
MPTDAIPAAASQPPHRGRRRGRLIIGLVAILVGLLIATAVGIRFGPQLVARQVVRTYLSGLNIDTSGVETLRIRPLQGELSFGPVTFRGAGAEMGQVGRIGVDIDVRRLLYGQLVAKSIVIEGVRFEARQAEDGSFSLNGIPLTEILDVRRERTEPTPSETGPQPAPPASPFELEKRLGAEPWLDLLSIRDSRIAFIDARGGEAVMHVDELELGGFHTWGPDRPGYYRLRAELNEISLTASGTARPFEDRLEVEAEASVTGINVEKIERFLGPLGFTSRGGEIALAVQRAWIGVFAEGRIESRLAATGTLIGIDLAHPLFGSGQLAGGTLKLDDVTFSYDAARQTTVTGDLSIDLAASTLRFNDGRAFSFSRVGFVLPGTRVRTAPGLQPEVKVAPQLDVDGLQLDGLHIRGSIGTASFRLSGFSIEGQQPGAPFFVTGRVAAERIDLLVPEAAPVAISAERMEIDLANTRLAFPPGQRAQVEGGLALQSQQLSVSAYGAATAGRPPPLLVRIDAGRFGFQLPALALDGSSVGDASLSAPNPLVSVDDLRLDGPLARGRVDRAELRLKGVGVAGADEQLTANGTLTMDRLDLLIPDVEPITIAIGGLQADLVDTSIALAPEPAPRSGSVSLDLRDVLFTLQEAARRGQPPPPLTTAKMARLTATVPTIVTHKASAADGSIGIAGPTILVDRLHLGGADIRGTVRSADVRLADLSVETNVPGPPIVATGKVVARDLDLVIPDVEPIGIAAREFSAALSRTRYAFPSRRSLIEGDFGLDAKDLAIRLDQQPIAGKPAPPPTRIAMARFAGRLPRLIVDERRRTSIWINLASPALALNGLRMEAAAGEDAIARLASSALTLRDADIDIADGQETLQVAVKAGAKAPDLSLVIVPQTGADGANGQIKGLDLDLRRVSYRREGDVNGLGLEGGIKIGSIEGQRPSPRKGVAADRLALAGLKLDVADAALTTGGARTAWRARLDLALKSLAATLQQPLPLTASVDDVSLGGLAATSGERYAATALTLGRFDVALTREAAAGPRPQPEPRAEEKASATGTWPPADWPVVQIGRIALLNGGRMALSDKTVSPTVKTTLTLDTFALDSLDTADPTARTTMQLGGRLDEAPFAIDGWAEAFQARPNFDARARIDALSLPTLSPYLGPRLGVDFQRGNLTVDADVAAATGRLAGTLRARMTDVRMADRPGAGSDEVARAIGVPLSTLIRLMEDRDGGITISLPIAGELPSPEINTRQAVWSLLPTIARAFFRSPVRFVSSATSLARAARSDRAPPPPAPPAASGTVD